MSIKIDESLVLNSPDSPLREGEIVETQSDILNIQSPRVGMTVYVRDEGVTYIIRSLKAKVIGGLTVQNAAVNEYEEYDVTKETERAKAAEGKLNGMGANLNARTKNLEENAFTQADIQRNSSNQTILLYNNAGDLKKIIPIIPVTSETAGLMTPTQRADIETLKQATATLGEGLTATNEKVNKIETVRLWSVYENMNDYTTQGMYVINGNRNHTNDNLPISNTGPISARLFVMTSENDCITQTLMFNNGNVGDGNVYIRTYHDGVWGNWSKLQTNVEVNAIGLGQSKTFDDLTDNNMYSGINVYQVGTDSNGYPITSYETFVLVVLNGYLTGAGVTQLKYSLLIDGTTRVQTRTRQNDVWSEWSNISGEEIPMATQDTAGIVKLGTGVINEKIDYNMPVTSFTNGLGWRLDSSSFVSQGGMLKLRNVATNEYSWTSVGGVSLKYGYALGTDTYNFADVIPLVKGYWEFGYQMGTDCWLKGITTGIPVARNKGLKFTSNGLEVDIDDSLDENSSRPVENKAVARSLVDAVEKGRQLALRALYISRGAVYNDTGEDKEVTVYWNVVGAEGSFTVTHKAGCYLLNGIGDITESEMAYIYSLPYGFLYLQLYLNQSTVRTIPLRVKNASGPQVYSDNLFRAFYNCIKLEQLIISSKYDVQNFNGNYIFGYCCRLRNLFITLYLITETSWNIFERCFSLENFFMYGLRMPQLNLTYSPNVTEQSILYAINRCGTGSNGIVNKKSIIIQLESSAYTRLIPEGATEDNNTILSAIKKVNDATAAAGYTYTISVVNSGTRVVITDVNETTKKAVFYNASGTVDFSQTF